MGEFIEVTGRVGIGDTSGRETNTTGSSKAGSEFHLWICGIMCHNPNLDKNPWHGPGDNFLGIRPPRYSYDIYILMIYPELEILKERDIRFLLIERDLGHLST